MHRLDVAAILSLVVGVGSIASDATGSAYITTLFGPHGPQVVAVLGMTGFVASQVLRIIGSPSGSPAGVNGTENPPQAPQGQKGTQP